MTAGVALVGPPGPGAWPRRLLCVSVNAAIDKISAVDRLVPGEIHRPEVLSVVPGGKALNVARAAAALGMPVRAVAVLGGHAGYWMEAALQARGIETRIVHVDGETRTCLSVLDRETASLTELYEPGLTLDVAGWAAVEDAIGAELAEDAPGTLVILAGSLPPGAPADAYARLVVLAARTGARAVVDADRRALEAALAARPWLVKVNAREAAIATGLGGSEEASAVAAARALSASTGHVALVTRGPEGAILVDPAEGVWRVGGPPEHGHYPVGSGDSLLAGFVVALASGFALPEAARRGGAVGAANALVPGQGTFDPADADRMVPAIGLGRVEPGS